MKFMLTASSISSMAISRMITFLRFKKTPTMLIANSTAPRTRKCESDSKRTSLHRARRARAHRVERLLPFFRRHGDKPYTIAAPDQDLSGRVLVLRVLAPA